MTFSASVFASLLSSGARQWRRKKLMGNEALLRPRLWAERAFFVLLSRVILSAGK
jgi:hypothetical protein